MEQIRKVTLKFKFTEMDIQLWEHYKAVIDAMKREMGNKITVQKGALHHGFRRNPSDRTKWEFVTFHDIVILYSRDVEEKILQAVA